MPLQTHGTPIQSDSRSGRPQPSAIEAKAVARADARSAASAASSMRA